MAYDADLAGRIRELLADDDGLTEKAMFGTRVFLLDGNMAVGVMGEALMVRVGADAAAALSRPHTSRAEMGGRPMKHWILVAPEALDAPGLSVWVQRGVDFARSRPPKG
jgi:hypothetical protein